MRNVQINLHHAGELYRVFLWSWKPLGFLWRTVAGGMAVSDFEWTWEAGVRRENFR